MFASKGIDDFIAMQSDESKTFLQDCAAWTAGHDSGVIAGRDKQKIIGPDRLKAEQPPQHKDMSDGLQQKLKLLELQHAQVHILTTCLQIWPAIYPKDWRQPYHILTAVRMIPQ